MINAESYEQWSIEIRSDRVPSNLEAYRVDVSTKCTMLPEGIDCFELIAEKGRIKALPRNLKVKYRMVLSGSMIEGLPDNLKIPVLTLRNCTNLRKLPENLEVFSLDVSGCVNLSECPSIVVFRGGRFAMAGCQLHTSIPAWLKTATELDITDCPNIQTLPDDLKVQCIHPAGSGLTRLPAASADAQIRWRGVLANELIAFHPERLTPSMVLAEANAERRRLMLELIGMEKFMQQVQAKIIDEDTDRGGARRLLHVPMPDDEDLVCLSVSCPSTKRNYVLRVPPTITSCHAAAAWIAGFENPSDYLPLEET